MRVYYDPKTDRALYTIISTNQQALPAGSWVEAKDDPYFDVTKHSVKNGVCVLTSLKPVQDEAIEVINRLVEDARQKSEPASSGQEQIHRAKKEEAVAYLALPEEPENLIDFPLLSGEVGITAPDAYSLAQLWLNMDAVKARKNADLEKVRIVAVQEVREAEDKPTVDKILLKLEKDLEKVA